MRTARKNIISGRGEQILFISNSFAYHTQPLTLDGREYFRQLMMDSAKKHDINMLAWCIMPSSYRIILGSTKTEQLDTVVRFSKSLQQRSTAWINYDHQTHGSIWKDRYESSELATPEEQLTGAVSVIAFPMLTDITDAPEDYYFTCYYHACAGNKHDRQGLATLIGLPGKPWAQVKRHLLKHIKTITNKI